MVMEKKKTSRKATKKAPTTSKNTIEKKTDKKDTSQNLDPVIKNLNIPKVKKDVVDEISELIDFELSKLKSELNSKNKKTTANISNIVNDLELKILEGLKDNSSIKKQLSTLKSVAFDELQKDIEESVDKKLNQSLSLSKTIIQKTENSMEDAYKQIASLEKQLLSLKASTSKIQNNDQNEFSKLRDEDVKQANFIVQKVNEIIDKVNSFEETFKVEEKKYMASLEKQFESQFEESEKKIRKELLHRIELELKVNHDDFEKSEKINEKNLSTFKQDISNHVKDYITSLDKELKTLKEKDSDLSLKEKAFMNKVKEQITFDVSKLESKLDAFRKESNDLIKKLDSKKERKVLNDEINESLNKSRELIKREFEIYTKTSHDKFEKLTEDLNSKIALSNDELNNNIISLTKQKDDLEKQKSQLVELINDLSDETTSKIQDQLTNLLTEYSNNEDKITELIRAKINEINSKELNIEENISIAINNSKNEIEEFFKASEKKNEALLKDLDSMLSNNLSANVDEFKGTLAKQIASNSDHLAKIEEKNSIHIQGLTEAFENKLVSATKFFEDDYDKHIAKFDEELKLKEEAFINKLLVIEDEKNQMVSDLASFKTEISQLTKEYIQSLNGQLEKLKETQKTFKLDKETFEKEIIELGKEKITEVSDHSDKIKYDLSQLVIEEREKFERHETTFREVFNDKISKLSDFQKKKLEQIEKKFVEKNVKKIDSQVQSSINELKLIEENVMTKVVTFEKRVEELSSKEDMLAENISIFENGVNKRVDTFLMNIDKDLNKKTEELITKEGTLADDISEFKTSVNERIEERLMGLEKSLNKRFLDLDGQFTSFKGVVVDEVEDLMKEINELVAKKVNEVDKYLHKINFAGAEVVKRISEFDSSKDQFAKEIGFIRDDLNDLRVQKSTKPEQLSSPAPVNVITSMAEYEENLVDLIKSLKSKQIPDNEIMNMLTHKGHPMFYVRMILSQTKQLK